MNIKESSFFKYRAVHRVLKNGLKHWNIKKIISLLPQQLLKLLEWKWSYFFYFPLFKAFFQHFMNCSIFKKWRFFYVHPLELCELINYVLYIGIQNVTKILPSEQGRKNRPKIISLVSLVFPFWFDVTFSVTHSGNILHNIQRV